MATSPHSPHVCWSASEDGCVRRLDTREPHSCQSEGSCRNIIIDLKLSSKVSVTQPVQCKCIDINPVQTEQIAVGAFDAYARIYDARLCTARSSSDRSSSSQGDPSCVAFFSPGHLSCSSSSWSKRDARNSVAATYVSFSSSGQELLVNLSGEQVYLYNTASHQQPITYEFDKTDANSIPKAKPILRTCSSSRHLSCAAGVGMKLMPLEFESCSVLCKTLDESEVGSEVVCLKNRGKELYKEEKLNEALICLNTAISQCSQWHVLYFLRGTTLYSRKW